MPVILSALPSSVIILSIDDAPPKYFFSKSFVSTIVFFSAIATIAVYQRDRKQAEKIGVGINYLFFFKPGFVISHKNRPASFHSRYIGNFRERIFYTRPDRDINIRKICRGISAVCMYL